MMDAYLQWLAAEDRSQDDTFRSYIRDVAQTRFVTRKVFRIVDEQARAAGVEPLQFQVLLQVLGAQTDVVHVNDVADRLDVAPAFASRLIKELEAKELLARSQSTVDRRMTRVAVTDAGCELVRTVDAAVHVHLDYFQKQLADRDRFAALTTFAFCVGLPADSPVATALRGALAN
ncbi:MAG: regulatory protein MarR [Actinomycetia bacterium]|nr:regulatory protein MarR [Actinomycetes bacterium]